MSHQPGLVFKLEDTLSLPLCADRRPIVSTWNFERSGLSLSKETLQIGDWELLRVSRALSLEARGPRHEVKYSGNPTSHLKRITTLSRTTVDRALNVLEALGYITVEW